MLIFTNISINYNRAYDGVVVSRLQKVTGSVPARDSYPAENQPIHYVLCNGHY